MASTNNNNYYIESDRDSGAGGPGIPAWFAGRHVLVTGATGFMGKVLVEKLLRSCGDLERLYIVVRQKKGRAVQERVDDMRKLPLFEPLLKRNPKALEKLHALEGDTTQVAMGLREEDQRLVQENVSVVFHLAAGLDWRASLHRATTENVVGTKNVLDFCKGMKKLEVLEYTSTAFCQCGEEVVEERVYEPPFDPHRLMALCDMFDERTMESIAPMMYGKHPNCYTYTKAVAEALAAEYADDIPMLIVRPSIVVPTLRDPIPGWVDTLNGPMGVMAAAGKGVLRSMMCRAENLAEVFPADICINAIIAATYKRALQPRDQREVIVYNACAGDLEETTWGEVLALGRKMVGVYPLEWTVWFPDGSIRTNYWEHMLIVFLFQTIPAYVIDFLLMLIGQERFMVRVQAKIKSGHDLLMFFTMRQWKFNNRNGRDTLWPTLNAKDRETFFMNNVLPVDKEKYLERAIFGTRTYCLKESPGTIKYCRRRLRVQQVVHNLCVALFYMGLVYAALQMASPYLLQLLPATLRERTVLMAATYSS
ncbi:putative fatty acyl-CoA reductase CG5065 [Frankliniella occidentalis]|uniref:Fatty acyl-CoA reductase n=1 Tax=Frankliniella occidentalis TaxID=133901 RepID=A0A9C6UAF3_FRAOC|nr:putative fatty acyl-CoA reductase CG5065 [Frankliniella occidentalis]